MTHIEAQQDIWKHVQTRRDIATHTHTHKQICGDFSMWQNIEFNVSDLHILYRTTHLMTTMYLSQISWQVSHISSPLCFTSSLRGICVKWPHHSSVLLIVIPRDDWSWLFNADSCLWEPSRDLIHYIGAIRRMTRQKRKQSLIIDVIKFL